MSQVRDCAHMARAIHLAEQGLYTTDPNPRVGCVLVRQGQTVGEGFHRRTGEPHAERNALETAGSYAKGATAYVTLEPCCHQGRTPPCTQALIEAGVSRVVAAMRDPNPRVAGKGLEQLAQAGIEVEYGLLEAQARALNPGFVKRMEQARPYLRCKLAMSLDGRTAMASGESKWITSSAARKDVQRLRARSSAVMTGVESVLRDDPSLNVRLGAGELRGVVSDTEVRQPVRVVLDSRLRLPPAARMLSLPGQVLVICTDASSPRALPLETAGVRLKEVAQDAGRVDLDAALRYLAEQEINEVLLETGPTLAGSVLSAGLIDELVIYLAPHIMGDGAQGLFRLPWLKRMQDRIGLRITDVRAVGEDWRISARPEQASENTG